MCQHCSAAMTNREHHLTSHAHSSRIPPCLLRRTSSSTCSLQARFTQTSRCRHRLCRRRTIRDTCVILWDVKLLYCLFTMTVMIQLCHSSRHWHHDSTMMMVMIYSQVQMLDVNYLLCVHRRRSLARTVIICQHFVLSLPVRGP